MSNVLDHEEISLFDGHLREGVDKRTGPLGLALSSIGVTADLLTLSGLIISLLTAVAIGTGHTVLGFFGVIASGIPDLLDGPVAKASGVTSKRGAFFDSFSDRVSDLLLFGGIGVLMLVRHNDLVAVVAFADYGVASLISYQRAKAESLGFVAKGGIMERAERIIAVAVGLLFSIVLTWVLWLVLVLSVVTAIQRFVKIWSQGTATMPDKLASNRYLYLQQRRGQFKRRSQPRRAASSRKRAGVRSPGQFSAYSRQSRLRASARMRSWWESQR